jgi:hypothetical protein
MAHIFLNINSIKYESESDLISLNFTACRVGESAKLNGFSEPIDIPINVWQREQSFTFSMVLDASTASTTETTTYTTSIAQVDFTNEFKQGDNINFKLIGQRLLGSSGYTFDKNYNISDGLNILINNINNVSGFSASVKDSSIIFTAPDKTGVYYNGFTIQTTFNNITQTATFSSGSTTFALSLGNSNYNLTI